MTLSPQEQLVACKAIIADVLNRFECSMQIEGNQLVIMRNPEKPQPRTEDDICPLPQDDNVDTGPLPEDDNDGQ